jgi:Mor family transcriptional regulator
MVSTRQERERLVLNLYNQGKNTREISQEARMSFSAIGAILKKAVQENETSKANRKVVPSSTSVQTLF